MKTPVLSLVALSAVLLTAGVAFGESKPAPAAAAPAAPAKPQKLAKVITITGAEAVRNFQNNVQVLQAQRQAALELQAAMEKEKDAKKKKELKTKLDEMLAKLNENNAIMAKTYGFSITRNYTLEIEVANIYMEVSDEEAAKIEQAEKAQKAKK